MGQSKKYQDLLPFCVTETQRTVVGLRSRGYTAIQTANQLGVAERNVHALCARVAKIAARQGHSPDHDMVHVVPDGFSVKGTSTLYKDGSPVIQWVKSTQDRERQMAMLLEAIESAHENLKPFERIKKPAGTDSDVLALLTITDFHLGMYAWEAETGSNWDSQIAERVFLSSVADMIDGTPPAQTGVFCQLGDFLHFDGLLAVTPTGGNLLDSDTRYSKLVEMTINVMTRAVEMMLEKFKKVVVIQAEGNHDLASSVWLRKHIKHVFSKNPRLEVIDNDFPFYAHLHGQTMLGFHHGHKVKMGSLQKIFSSEPRFREMWGQAKQCYIHTGHMHHERVVEDAGAIVEQHPTLAGRDAYSARLGHVSLRGAKVITYHAVHGEIHRTTVRPIE